jgi:hypothetical protein
MKKLYRVLLKAQIWLLNWLMPESAARLAVRVFARVERVGRPPWEQSLVSNMRRHVFANGCVGYISGHSARRVLLVHGWAGRGTQLGFFISRLNEQGFEAICLDGPAHGESPGSYTYPMHFALYLKNVVDELGGVDGVIAHSFGAGASALAVGLGMKTRSLVYIGGFSEFKPVLEFFCKVSGLTGLAKESFLQEGGYRNGGPIENLRIDKIPELRGFPLLLVHDYDDAEVPIGGILTLAKTLGTRTLFTKGLGHHKVLRDPDVISRSVEFIALKSHK